MAPARRKASTASAATERSGVTATGRPQRELAHQGAWWLLWSMGTCHGTCECDSGWLSRVIHSTPLRDAKTRCKISSAPAGIWARRVGSDPVPEGAVRGRLSAVSCGGLIILVTHSRQSLGILNVHVSSRRSRLATLILPQHTSISRLVRFAKPERSSPCRRSLLSTSIARTPNSAPVLRPRVSPPDTPS